MQKTFLIATTFAAVSGAALASDDRDDRRQPLTDVPRAEWMSVSQIAQTLEARGYVVREIDTERGAYEIEATDANGLRVKAYVHPVTAEILPYAEEDD